MGWHDKVCDFDCHDGENKRVVWRGNNPQKREKGDSRVIGWGPFCGNDGHEFLVVFVASGHVTQFVTLDPTVTDLTNHVAFCKGHLPAHAYADWLEESGVDLPAEAYNLLRGW